MKLMKNPCKSPQEVLDLSKNPTIVDHTATISLVEENFDSDPKPDKRIISGAILYISTKICYK